MPPARHCVAGMRVTINTRDRTAFAQICERTARTGTANPKRRYYRGWNTIIPCRGQNAIIEALGYSLLTYLVLRQAGAALDAAAVSATA